MKRGRRAQVSLFIIIGIIILFFVVILFSFKTNTQNPAKQEAQVQTITQSVPLNVQPIQEFVTQCIESLSKDALTAIGAHGGWIGTDEESKQYTLKTFKINPASVVESDAVTFAPGSTLQIPYWRYLSSKNTCSGDCTFDSLRPTLHRNEQDISDHSIESQIDRYVTINLPICTKKFEGFSSQGYTVTTGAVQTKSFIRDHDVFIQVTYPLQFTNGDSTKKISDFSVTLPIEFKQLYQMATEILEVERQFHYFEKQTWNLINWYSLGVNKNTFPPPYEFQMFEKDRVTWIKDIVDSRMKNVLAKHIPLFSIQNTATYSSALSQDDSVKRDIYYQFQIPPLTVFGNVYQTIGVSFNFFSWWDLYSAYRCNGCNGQLIKGEAGPGNIPFLSDLFFQKYETSYDLSYPVVVHLTNPDGFNNVPFDFTFAFEVNLRNGKPFDFTYQNFDTVVPRGSSLLCDDNERNTGNMKIIAVDAYTKKSLEDAQITFNCGEGCYLGSTRKKDDGIYFKDKLPVCGGALLSVAKSNFMTGFFPLSTHVNSEKIITVPLFQKKEKNVKVLVKRNLLVGTPTGHVWQFINDAKPLFAGEEATIILERIKENSDDEEVIGTVPLTNNQLGNVTLVPGMYKVSIILLSKTPFVIPKKEIDDGIPFNDDPVVPEISFTEKNPFFEGETILDTETMYWTLTPDVLYGKNDITFYAIAGVTPMAGVEQEDLAKIDTSNLVKQYRKTLEPTVEATS